MPRAASATVDPAEAEPDETTTDPATVEPAAPPPDTETATVGELLNELATACLEADQRREFADKVTAAGL